MRILYPVRVDSYWPIGTIFREVGKRLSHDVTAFANRQSDNINLENITTIPVGKTKRKRAWSYAKVNIKSSSYNLIHTAPMSHNLIAALGQVAAPTTHIHTIHNAEWGINRGIYPYVNRQILVSLCDQLTAVSSYAAAVADCNTWKQQETAVIPNGVDVDLFEPNQAETVSNRALYVGRMADRKHPEMIINIAEKLPEYKFRARISGLNNDHKLFDKIKNQNNVKLLEYLSRPKLAREYAAAEVFLAPYEREGFGMTVLEALSSGTPVIGYESGNLPDLLCHTGGRLVKSLSAPEWIKEIKTIDPEPAGRSARRFAEDYRWDVVAAKYEDLYDCANS